MRQFSDKFLRDLRAEFKLKENKNKKPLISADVVQTGDFVFSKSIKNEGDSGQLLLAKRKSNKNERYLVKHAFTDCACNEFVYTKLMHAMGYAMPDAVLFQLSPDEKRQYFKTGYTIGERFLNVVNSAPSYKEIREKAINWTHFFAFYAMYGMVSEADGVEILLADDGLIYRVDTTDAFLISNYYLDFAGIDIKIDGKSISDTAKDKLLSSNFDNIFYPSVCDSMLENCLEKESGSFKYFLEPFERIQEIKQNYIDDFLNTLCYFYPDFIGEYFKRYISSMKKYSEKYLREKRRSYI